MYHIRMYLVSAGYPDTYVPGISRQTNVPPVDAHTSDDSYMYQLSLVVATATVSLFERSEFLIATSPKKVCVFD